MTKRLIQSLSLILLVTACSHTSSKHGGHSSCDCQKKEQSSVVDQYMKFVGPKTKLGSLEATTFKHMSFSAQPSKEDFQAAKKMGYETIINIRKESEVNWNVGQYVKSLGLNYYNVPLLNDQEEIDPAAVMKLEKIHKDTHKQKQLIYCSTGNRAAAWMAVHLMVKHDLSAADALKVARPLGITKPEIEKRVENFEKTVR